MNGDLQMNVASAAEVPAPRQHRLGSVLRWLLLIGNGLLGAITAFYCSLITTPWLQYDWWPLLQVAISLLSVAPLMLACVVAAWGPWRWTRRCLIVPSAIVAWACCSAAAQLSGDRETHVSELLSQFFRFATVFVTTSLCLVMIGSLMRLRLGPSFLRPVRVTILGLMGATTVVSVLVTVNGYVDHWAYQHTASKVTSYSPYDSDQLTPQFFLQQAMLQVLIFAPCVALFIAFSAASGYRWSARLLVTALPIGFAGYNFYTADWNANVFPRSTVWIPIIAPAMLIPIAYWIGGTVFLLDRSGWPIHQGSIGKR